MYSVGIHLILVPKSGYMAATNDSLLKSVVESTLTTNGGEDVATFIEGKVLQDHVHILLGSKAADELGLYIDKIIRSLTAIEQMMGDDGFEFDEGVHVTLLPPWHLQILASFVRDQDNYHKTRSLEMELDEVFRPNERPVGVIQ